ncbi:MAG: NADH dehydrogenase [Lentisphaerae bacterium RIFOXYB12_FULL_65_16]|nr:MAG: NADH dehydrogenase [Lentisphaerae bacterium RIFOXYA12_64_32]OGV93938.1 MAG: NADH dehydrogenase [Lentisphaerae bacterium RIFOXYB12_FULL_65_16]
MDKSALLDMIYVLAFLVGGLGMGLAPIIIPFFLAPRRTRSINQKTLEVIECGMDTIGPTWMRLGVVFYLYALIFIAFAVDVLFLLPVAVVYNKNPGWLELAEVVLFVGILALVIVYAWKKNVFTWKNKSKSPQL